MKIATITCHNVYNYGATLQAYALQTFCEQNGADYTIVNYRPPYLSGHFKLGAVSNPRFDKPLLKQLYLALKFPSRVLALQKKRKFDNFEKTYYKLSHKEYSNNNELKTDCPDADLYIAGSDQIWNTLFPNGHDKAFYLDFVGKRGRKISYAASFATDRIYGNAQEFVKTNLQNFDAISVRETSGQDILKNLNDNNGQLVCDPVFLLDKTQWEDLVNQKYNQEYKNLIVIYDCERNTQLREIALELKRRTNCKIAILSSTCGHYSDVDFSKGGPIEFLSLIANAQYVIANSFHALAFSIIFQREFFIINRSEDINTRMRDFLTYLDMPERLIASKEGLVPDKINWEACQKKMTYLIQQSKAFIITQMDICRNTVLLS